MLDSLGFDADVPFTSQGNLPIAIYIWRSEVPNICDMHFVMQLDMSDVIKLIDDAAGVDITFSSYPKSSDYILDLMENMEKSLT